MNFSIQKFCHGTVLIFIIASMSSCGWWIFGKTEEPAAVREAPPPIIRHQPQISGRIVDRQRLQQGGKLVIVPFTAGSDVPAGEETDRLALRLIEGMAEGLQEQDLFQLVFDREAERADLLIKGRIAEHRAPGLISRWLLRKKGKYLTISGQMLDPEDRELIMTFHYRRKSKDKNFEALAAEMGRDLARFLTAGAGGEMSKGEAVE